MLQISDYVLVFKDNDEDKQVNVFKLEKISSAKPKVTALPSLSRYVRVFAIALFQGETVFLSGGFDSNDDSSNAVSALDLKQWHWSDAPSML